MKIASRLLGITASPTMAVMEEAQKLRKAGVDVIDLGPGEPDFPTPDHVKKAGIEAIQQNYTRYTPSAGILELRRAVAEHYNRVYGSDYSEANVIICCGGKHAVYDVCMAVFEAPDEVILPAPYWVTFPEVIRMAEATPVVFQTRPENRFELEIDSVKQAMSPRTRGIIVNSPCNPTGAVFSEKTVDELVNFCRDSEVFLISDETYDYFVYGDHQHFSVAGKVDSSERFYAIVGSLSKTYSMTGWRIGYCVGHRDLIKKLSEFQSHQSGNPVSISQKAALAALNSDSDSVDLMTREYGVRREMVLKGLAEIPGFHCPEPNGAFYAFPEVTGALQATGIADSVEFAKFLIQKARVATVPGSAFGTEGHIRISYATSRENLQEAMLRMKKAVEEASH